MIEEVEMDIPDVDKSLAKIGVPRRMRKKIRRASHSPKLKIAAALVPFLTAGFFAARTIARRGR
jgi:hypothetical protein